MQPFFTVTDILLGVLLLAFGAFLLYARTRDDFREVGRRLRKSKLACTAIAVASLYMLIGFMDSLHYRLELHTDTGAVLVDKEGQIVYGEVRSLLDECLARWYGGVRIENERIVPNFEDSYSAPLADEQFDPDVEANSETGETILVRKPLDSPRSHILGTDRAGNDIFYRSLKGVRTAIIIGLLTSLIAVPFAMLFGITAGYFGGWVDDLIQFIYTTLSSVPSLLLIISLIMIINSKFERYVSIKTTGSIIEKDAWLIFGICCILGVIGWAGLCRLLRAETLKLRELDYVQAARTLGAGDLSIIMRHIVPNVMHIVLISFILQFSGLVMVEVILQYIKVGMPSTVISWGRMIDDARMELGRDPMITWPVWTAFFAMFFLILAVNYIADIVRDALDPRLRQ